jgi:hypothetical protein
MFRSEHVEQIAGQRLAVCMRCNHLDKEGKTCIAPGTQPCCNQCGCSLHLKTRSLSSSCPRNYWEAVLSQAEADALDHALKNPSE